MSFPWVDVKAHLFPDSGDPPRRKPGRPRGSTNKTKEICGPTRVSSRITERRTQQVGPSVQDLFLIEPVAHFQVILFFQAKHLFALLLLFFLSEFLNFWFINIGCEGVWCSRTASTEKETDGWRNGIGGNAAWSWKWNAQFITSRKRWVIFVSSQYFLFGKTSLGDIVQRLLVHSCFRCLLNFFRQGIEVVIFVSVWCFSSVRRAEVVSLQDTKTEKWAISAESTCLP